MDLEELKLVSLGIKKEKLGRIFSFIDFGNVNYWYEKDRRDGDDHLLPDNKKLIVDIAKLASFLNLFAEQKRFYYGWHYRIKSSWHIIIWAEKNGFIKITKPIQFIKHYLDGEELPSAKIKSIKRDFWGKFIEIPKSNFDVEISIDSIRLMEKYDTFCLLSGDSDFVGLIEFLKKRGKKIIIVAPGHIVLGLKEKSDLYINSQQIKSLITTVK
jgi:uncharacterized LabA/DUF88 family protein